MKQYPAIYRNSEPIEQRINGTLHCNGNELQFLSNEINYAIPLEKLDIDAGNGRSRFIFFRNKEQPQICVYTEDRAIFNEDWIRGNTEVMALVKNSRRIRHFVIGFLLSAVMLVLLLVFAIFFFRHKIVRSIATKIPPKWEIQAGEQFLHTIEMQHTLLKNDSLLAVLSHQAQPLIQQCQHLPYPVHIHINRDTVMNAFALPGGNLIINSGLIAKAGSWEELLGVLSHEIAHITLKHHSRGIVQQVGLQSLLSWWLGGGNDAGAAMGKIGGELANLAYSREFEQEADDEGFAMLEKAKISPQGMISFFQRIQAEENKDQLSAEKSISFLSTHPSTPDRVMKLRKKLGNRSTDYISQPGWTTFQSAVHKALGPGDQNEW